MLKMRQEPVTGGRRKAAVALLKRAPRRALSHASDLLRVLAFLVLGAASYLPRSWGRGIADFIGGLYASSPVGKRAWKSFALAFPNQDARKLAREWITRPGRDYLAMHRLRIGHDNVTNMAVDSRCEPALLREPGQSLIIALGHFSREANIAIYKSGVIPKRVAATIAPLERRSWRPRAMRIKIQITAIMDGIVCARGGDVDVVPFDGPAALTRLVKHLRRPDSVVTISTDAVTERGRERGHERPFAGHACLSFALGTARLARLSQRPILVCVPFLDENCGLAIEWGEPIPAPARDDESADARITDAILDFLERAIGERPGQYVLPIGHERRWDQSAHRWLPLD